jgi:hypothetical protein
MKKIFVLAVLATLLVVILAPMNAESYQVIEQYQKYSMPDFGQHSSGWCWVAAAKNSFWWFSENGFPQLEDDPGGAPGNGEWKKIDPESMGDDDADGLIDEDPVDGVDNDGDGNIDEDPYDGIDNDGDNMIGELPHSKLWGIKSELKL